MQHAQFEPEVIPPNRGRAIRRRRPMQRPQIAYVLKCWRSSCRARRWPDLGYERIVAQATRLECAIADAPDRPQRMIWRHTLLQRDVAEHRSGLLVGSAHRSAPFVSG